MTILQKLKALKRWDQVLIMNVHATLISPNGDWVKFSDIEAIIEELEKEVAEKTFKKIATEFAEDFNEKEEGLLQAFRESLKGGKVKIREK